MTEIYDIIIVGTGPAGLTAGIYCAQAGFKVAALERELPGGQLVNIEKVENYPGFPDGISGAQLSQAMLLQAMKYGVELKMEEVMGLEVGSKNKLVKTVDNTYLSKAVIIASGGHPMRLGMPGEEKFIGEGVAYCALCEGGQFKNKVVGVVGGGDAGVTEALYLTKIASKIIIVEIMPELTAKSLLQRRARENEKIEIICSTKVEAILGNNHIEAIQLLNIKTKEVSNLRVDGVLVHVGWEPQTKYLEGVLSLDNQMCVVVNETMATELPGVFAAGDLRQGSLRQVATAIGDGATAAIVAQRYLREVS
ncbi:MAG: FAD-dependent oxidoreductase [Thermodesulfobacteriota bacterium]